VLADSQKRITGEDKMNYLSFGGGVDSTALMLLLLDKNIKFETVFVDHETDYPETYEYVEYLKEKGFKITSIKPSVSWKGTFSSVYDYFYFHKSIPLIPFRICTDKFKVRTFNKYVKTPCVIYLGYDYDEVKRVEKQKNRKLKKGIKHEYPLIENKLTRNGCIDYIKSHNLKIPRKSGCFICPFQRKKDWRDLEVKHPDLFQKALDLEKHSGKVGLFGGRKTLSSIHQTTKLYEFVGYDGDLSCDKWKCRE
jgi:3'-phosphoadenosine 5'-phosphosulfate sulfotransferase (PAPS reductase)/FAD synthetase